MTTETNAERLKRIKALKESYRLKCLVVSTESELVYSPDMEWLIQQAERARELEKEKTKALKRAKDFEKECRKSIVRLGNCENNYKILHENNVRLCEALEFYEDEEKYKVSIGERSIAFRTVLVDGGETARQALKGPST